MTLKETIYLDTEGIDTEERNSETFYFEELEMTNDRYLINLEVYCSYDFEADVIGDPNDYRMFNVDIEVEFEIYDKESNLLVLPKRLISEIKKDIETQIKIIGV